MGTWRRKPDVLGNALPFCVHVAHYEPGISVALNLAGDAKGTSQRLRAFDIGFEQRILGAK